MTYLAQILNAHVEAQAESAVAPHAGMWAFLIMALVVILGLGFLLRNMVKSLADTAGQHAGKYAISYVKGSALIMISMMASFQETWGMVTASDVRLWQWWDFVISFAKPFAAGLAVLVAFLDRSMAPPSDKPPTP